VKADPVPEKKVYERPCIRLEKEIEALAGTCEPLGMDTMQDKLSFDPASGLCRNPLT
jgi:hypothetical protein